jgi:hypothetical protein
MAIPIAVIVRLIPVIHYLMNGHFAPLDHVIIDGHVNYNALRSAENILTQKGRDDVLEIVHQTRAGKIIVEPEKNYSDSPQANPIPFKYPIKIYLFKNPILGSTSITLSR